jgi:FlaA1/EpsC-like NDP-sugar epimerase
VTVGLSLTLLDFLAVALAMSPGATAHGWSPVLAAALVGCLCARLFGLQSSRLVLAVLPELPRLLLVALAATATLVLASPVLSVDHGRGWAQSAVYTLAVFALMGLLRAAAYGVTRLFRHAEWGSSATVVVGSDDLGRRLATELLLRRGVGLRPIGFVDCGRRLSPRGLPLPQLGDLDEMASVLREHEARDVVFACTVPPERQPVEAVRECVHGPYRVFVVAGTYPATPQERGRTEVVAGIPLTHLPARGAGPFTRLLRWAGGLLGVGNEPAPGSHRGSPDAPGSNLPEVHARELAS